MRPLTIVLAMVAVAALVIATGTYVGSGAVPPRASDQTIGADPAWYTNLPADPDAAAAAYLARIPASMREKGERYGDTRLVALSMQVMNLLAATLFLSLARFCGRLRTWASRLSGRPAAVDTLAVLGYFGALFVLTLPGELYGGFMRPHWFGFSDQSFWSWLSDTLTNWVVLAVFYLAGVLAVYRVMRWRPHRWVLWSIGVYFALRVAYALLAPWVVEPLTNDFKPLPDGPQKQQILALAQAAGVGSAEIVTADASRQTRVPNAHVSGLGRWSRISVDDNTLDASSEPMLRAVVGHELGHYALHHVALAAVMDTAVMSFGFLFVAAAMGFTIGRWGPRLGVSGAADINGLPIFWGTFLFWGFLSLPLSNAISRELERQADLYSLEAAREPLGLAEFMIHDADRARLQPTALEYALFFDHPSDAERVRAAMSWRASHLAAGRRADPR